MRRGSAILAVLLVAACSEPVEDGPDEPAAPAPAAGDAAAKYAAVHGDLVDALAGRLPESAWRRKDRYPAVTEQPDGRCILFLREDLARHADLPDATDELSALGGWLDPILAKHGFPALAEPARRVDGSFGTGSRDPAGWEVEVDLQGSRMLVSTEGPVSTDRCDESVVDGMDGEMDGDEQ